MRHFLKAGAFGLVTISERCPRGQSRSVVGLWYRSLLCRKSTCAGGMLTCLVPIVGTQLEATVESVQVQGHAVEQRCPLRGNCLTQRSLLLGGHAAPVAGDAGRLDLAMLQQSGSLDAGTSCVECGSDIRLQRGALACAVGSQPFPPMGSPRSLRASAAATWAGASPRCQPHCPT